MFCYKTTLSFKNATFVTFFAHNFIILAYLCDINEVYNPKTYHISHA